MAAHQGLGGGLSIVGVGGGKRHHVGGRAVDVEVSVQRVHVGYERSPCCLGRWRPADARALHQDLARQHYPGLRATARQHGVGVRRRVHTGAATGRGNPARRVSGRWRDDESGVPVSQPPFARFHVVGVRGGDAHDVCGGDIDIEVVVDRVYVRGEGDSGRLRGWYGADTATGDQRLAWQHHPGLRGTARHYGVGVRRRVHSRPAARGDRPTRAAGRHRGDDERRLATREGLAGGFDVVGVVGRHRHRVGRHGVDVVVGVQRVDVGREGDAGDVFAGRAADTCSLRERFPWQHHHGLGG